MKTYIMTIIGATLLSAFSNILSPEKWRKYVSLVTGLVIIGCIISPITSITKTDVFNLFEEFEVKDSYNYDLQREAVLEELGNRINGDIEQRLKNEFNIYVTARAAVRVNGAGEIEGVERVRLYGDKVSEKAVARICEVYGITADEVEYE